MQLLRSSSRAFSPVLLGAAAFAGWLGPAAAVTFAPAASFPGGEAVDIRTRDVVVADFDEDGHPDIAVSNYGAAAPQPPQHTGSVMMLWGDGTGTFSAPQVWKINSPETCCPTLLATADIDGDGHGDLVVDYQGVRIYWGTGTRTPGPESLLRSEAGHGLAIADLDGDDDLDVVAARDTQVEVFFNDGSRTFYSALYPAVSSINYVHVAQLDGQYGPDIAASGFWSSQLGFLCSDGGGGFHSPLVLAAGALTSDFAIGEFTGDQNLDVLYARRGCFIALVQQAARRRVPPRDGARGLKVRPFSVGRTSPGENRGHVLTVRECRPGSTRLGRLPP